MVALAMPLAWMASQVNVIRERRKMLEAITASGGWHSSCQVQLAWERPQAIVPMLRQIIGDTAVDKMCLVGPMENEPVCSYVEALFPEAELYGYPVNP